MPQTIASTSQLSAWTDRRIKVPNPDPRENNTVMISPMMKLWQRFDGAMPGSWASNFTRPGAIDNWAESWAHVFVKQQLTMAEIARGLDNLDQIPANDARYGRISVQQFIALCRPKLSDEDAYHEAIKQLHKRRTPFERDGRMVTADVWSEPAIYWAAIRMESDLLTQPYERIKGRWARALDYARTHPKGEVPLYMLALPEKSSVGLSEVEQRAAEVKQQAVMAEILAKLGKRSPEASPKGRKMKTLSDDDLTARKAALDQLLAAKQQRERQQGEGENAEQG